MKSSSQDAGDMESGLGDVGIGGGRVVAQRFTLAQMLL